MAEPLPDDALGLLLQAVGPIDALQILLLLRRRTDRTRSTDEIAGELGVPPKLVEATLAELESHCADTSAALDSQAGALDERRLEMIRVVCSRALAHARATADLLARALGAASPNQLTLDGHILDGPTFGDGFLERAARQGFKLVDIERAYVQAVLRVVGGNKSEAARRLGINRRTLQRRLGDGDELHDDDDADDHDEDEGDDVRAVQD